jgi:hypothetical protein
MMFLLHAFFILLVLFSFEQFPWFQNVVSKEYYLQRLSQNATGLINWAFFFFRYCISSFLILMCLFQILWQRLEGDAYEHRKNMRPQGALLAYLGFFCLPPFFFIQ